MSEIISEEIIPPLVYMTAGDDIGVGFVTRKRIIKNDLGCVFIDLKTIGTAPMDSENVGKCAEAMLQYGVHSPRKHDISAERCAALIVWYRVQRRAFFLSLADVFEKLERKARWMA